MTNLTYAAATVSKWSFHIEDVIDLTATGIRERAREWRASSTTATRALIVVAYLQLLADECDAAVVLRSLLGTAKETRSSLLLVSQQLADAHQRATLESIATAVFYLRADAQAHIAIPSWRSSYGCMNDRNDLNRLLVTPKCSHAVTHRRERA